jgi:uncharacterized protein (DUF983 family)
MDSGPGPEQTNGIAVTCPHCGVLFLYSAATPDCEYCGTRFDPEHPTRHRTVMPSIIIGLCLVLPIICLGILASVAASAGLRPYLPAHISTPVLALGLAFPIGGLLWLTWNERGPVRWIFVRRGWKWHPVDPWPYGDDGGRHLGGQGRSRR